MTFTLLLTYLGGIFPVWFTTAIFIFIACCVFFLIFKIVAFVKDVIPFL